MSGSGAPPLPEVFLAGAWIPLAAEEGSWSFPSGAGHGLVVGDARGTRVVDAPSGEVQAAWPWVLHADHVLDHRLGKLLVRERVGGPGHLRLLDLESGEEVWRVALEAPGIDAAAVVARGAAVAVAAGRTLHLLDPGTGAPRGEVALPAPASAIGWRPWSPFFFVRGDEVLQVFEGKEATLRWTADPREGAPRAAALAGEPETLWVAYDTPAPRLVRVDLADPDGGPCDEVALEGSVRQLEVPEAGGALYALLRGPDGLDRVAVIDSRSGRERWPSWPLAPPDTTGRFEVEAIHHGPGETWLYARLPRGMTYWEVHTGALLEGGGPLGAEDEEERLERAGLTWAVPRGAPPPPEVPASGPFPFAVAWDEEDRLGFWSTTTERRLLTQPMPTRARWTSRVFGVAPSGELVVVPLTHPESTFVKRWLVDLGLLTLDLRNPRTLRESLRVRGYRKVVGPWPPPERILVSPDGSRIALAPEERPEVYVHTLAALEEASEEDELFEGILDEPPPRPETPEERIAADPELARLDARIEALEDDGMGRVDAVEARHAGRDGGYADTAGDAAGAAWSLLQGKLDPLRDKLRAAARARIAGDTQAARRALDELREELLRM